MHTSVFLRCLCDKMSPYFFWDILLELYLFCVTLSSVQRIMRLFWSFSWFFLYDKGKHVFFCQVFLFSFCHLLCMLIFSAHLLASLSYLCTWPILVLDWHDRNKMCLSFLICCWVILERPDDEELQCYLLQLVQALRWKIREVSSSTCKLWSVLSLH